MGSNTSRVEGATLVERGTTKGSSYAAPLTNLPSKYQYLLNLAMHSLIFIPKAPEDFIRTPNSSDSSEQSFQFNDEILSEKENSSSSSNSSFLSIKILKIFKKENPNEN